MVRHVLITGASIAGNALAWWLGRNGFEVTVVERAPAFRDGGQNVDVRGAARTVLERMGLLQTVRENGTGESGVRFVDRDGATVAEFPLEELGGDAFTAELEILRGDLARLLYDGARGHAHYRFGDAIDSVETSATGARVRFDSGSQDDYDLVLVAEGVGSSTRERVFPGENAPRWLDVTMGYFTIPKGAGDGAMARWYTAPGGRSVFLRPDRKGSTRAVLTLQGPAQGNEGLAPERQKAFLRDHFAGAGWETARVLDGMEQAEDFYFDVLRQVKMARWSNGRVALAGDAAWCTTPLGGVGASLSLIGAYVLAGELCGRGGDVGADVDVEAALAAYERIMRPLAEKGQDVPKFGPRLAQPHSRLGVHLQSALLHLASLPGLRTLVAKAVAGRADEIDLPDYPALRNLN